MPAQRVIEQLPSIISFKEAEAIAARLNEGDELTLDISRFRRTRLFGEGALLGLMMLARTRGIEVHVQLGGELPSFSKHGDNRYWKIFTQSISGFVLAQLAHAVYDNRDRDVTSTIRSQQSQILKSEEGYIGSGKEIAAAIADRFGAPKPAAVVVDNNPTNFRHLLAFALASRLGLNGEPTGAFANVAMFASELLENTRDHATTDIEERPIEGVRFLNIRRINPDQEDLSDLSPPQDSSNSYSDALSSILSASELASHLVEVTVSDSGPGIAARMEQRTSIYDGPIEKERRAIMAAMQRGGSSKQPSVTGRGLGLQNVLDATDALGGLFVLRTGRTRLYRYGQASDPQTRIQLSGTTDPALQYLPGTSISIIFPWKIRDPQLSLFGGTDANSGR